MSVIERIWALVSPTTTLTSTRPRPPRLAAARCRCGLASLVGYACYCQHGAAYVAPPAREVGAMRMVRHRTYRRALDRAERAEQATRILADALDRLGARIYRDLHVDSESYAQICDPPVAALLSDFSTLADTCLDALADARVLAVLNGGAR